MIRRWLSIAVMVAVVAITASLGSWQLQRGAAKDALQAQRDAARSATPLVPIGDTVSLASFEARRVRLSGRLDEARTVFLDNRTRKGVAGYHVLTPMRLDDGGAWVMVLRGWVARDVADRTRLPELTALPAPLSIEGFAQAVLQQPMVLTEQSPPAAGERLWQRYDADTFRRWSGLSVVDGVVRQTTETPDGLARDWVEPGSGADKHRAYAFQWFAMSALAAAVTVVLVWRAGRAPGARQRDA